MSGTRQKTPGEQSPQTLGAEGWGEALDAENKEAEPLMAKPAPESPALAEQLMEEVCDRGNLERAWKRVRSNKGTAFDRGAPPIRQWLRRNVTSPRATTSWSISISKNSSTESITTA